MVDVQVCVFGVVGNLTFMMIIHMLTYLGVLLLHPNYCFVGLLSCVFDGC